MWLLTCFWLFLLFACKKKGAKLIDLEKYKLGKVVVVKQDGSTLYITRDIAAAVSRWEKHHFDHQFYVVAKQQDLHFQQLFKTLEIMGHGEISSRCTHINFGMVKGDFFFFFLVVFCFFLILFCRNEDAHW